MVDVDVYVLAVVDLDVVDVVVEEIRNQKSFFIIETWLQQK